MSAEIREDLREFVAWLRMLVARLEEIEGRVGPGGKVYLTLEEAEKLTSIPAETLKKKIYAQELPAYKPGKQLLVRWADLRAFIERHPGNRNAFTEPERTLTGKGVRGRPPVRYYPK